MTFERLNDGEIVETNKHETQIKGKISSLASNKPAEPRRLFVEQILGVEESDYAELVLTIEAHEDDMEMYSLSFTPLDAKTTIRLLNEGLNSLNSPDEDEVEKTASELAIERFKAAGISDPDVEVYSMAVSMGFSLDAAAAKWIDQMFDANDPDWENEIIEAIKREAKQKKRQRVLLEKLAAKKDKRFSKE